uniref:Molybdopterin molybdenumtransferase MoeA n=1 Tax=Ignisphaera aggregans TaxID=334771 RepID=A0A7J3JSE0_9CREN
MEIGFSYTRIDECIENLARITNLSIEAVTVDLDEALNKIAYDTITSPIDIPPYDRSAVDGYALCSEATTSASPSNPIPLVIKNKGNKIDCSEALPVSTGDRLPLGADAVVMLEDTYTDNTRNIVYITRSVPKYLNVSRMGEDIKRGDTIVEKGRLIKPWHIAAVAAIGLSKIRVYRGIKIGVITVGSELKSGGIDVYSEGGVIDVTSKLLMSSLREYEFIEPKWYGIVEDSEEKIALLLHRAVIENDIVITSGGTGPGSRDVTFNVLNFLRNEMKIGIISRGVAMRPGRPTTIATINGKPLFMLSGFPIAAYIALRVLVVPFIARLLNIQGIEPIEVPAILTRRAVGSIGYDVFARIKAYRCEDSICAEPIAIHGSGVLRTLMDANAILHIKHNLEGFDKGDKVWIQIL